MNKSLYVLAQEYDEAINTMLEWVNKLKQEKAQARKSGDADALKLISAKLYVAYEEIRDMRMIAEHLKGYYNDNEKNEVCA